MPDDIEMCNKEFSGNVAWLLMLRVECMMWCGVVQLRHCIHVGWYNGGDRKGETGRRIP